MVMGVGILLITNSLGKIGTKRQMEFMTGTDTEDVKEVNARIARICEEWCTEKDLVQKLQISMDALMEGFYEHNPYTQLSFKIWYDQLQIKLDVKSENIELTEKDWAEDNFTTLSVSLMMLRNMFDNVKISQVDKSVLIHLDAIPSASKPSYPIGKTQTRRGILNRANRMDFGDRTRPLADLLQPAIDAQPPEGGSQSNYTGSAHFFSSQGFFNFELMNPMMKQFNKNICSAS
jgi:hypothetical protein